MSTTKRFYQELLVFSIIMVIFGFLTSYLIDFVLRKEIILLPSHSLGMASGIFFTSVIVFVLFSKKYINYKCSQ
jgi:hypothetical protein